MKIVLEFEQAFAEDCKGLSPIETLRIMNKRKAIDIKAMEKYLIMRDFEKLCDERGGFCEECFKKVPNGVIPALMDKYCKEERTIKYIIANR